MPDSKIKKPGSAFLTRNRKQPPDSYPTVGGLFFAFAIGFERARIKSSIYG
jgi:hypothetical protein